jgi:enoyl-CoA hydratase/carnithine racemase
MGALAGRTVVGEVRRAAGGQRRALSGVAARGAGALRDVQVSAQGPGVALVLLDRPARLNALSLEMGRALCGLETLLPAGTRAVVVTGAGGKAFSTGRDLKDSKAHSAAEAAQYMALARDSVLAVRALGLPTVGALNGFAFGWGLELALACDLRVASRDAVLCFPETGLGIFPGALGTVLLPRLVGASVAKDLILTARRFSGSEAFELGVANRVAASADECVAVALKLAATIGGNAPLGVRGARAVIDQGLDMDFEGHVRLSDAHRLPLNDTEDFREALLAFEQKRPPRFQGK